MHLQNPWGLFALLAIPAILILYLLKRKHPERVVPSLFLWNRAAAQTQAARPWQKLKTSLLLALQLAAAAVLALALSAPVIPGRERVVAGIYVLDTSLSMSAADEKPTRLEAAKAAVREAVRSTPAGTPLSLVVMGSQARIAANGLTDKSAFLTALDSVEAENAGADWEGAATMAALLREQTGGTVAVYTDSVYDFGNLGAEPVYFGKNGGNGAVTLLSLSQPQNGTVTALVRVKSYAGEAQTRTVTLYGDEAALDVQEVTLAPGEEKDLYFSGIPAETTVYLARLSAGDVLEADDSRVAVQNAASGQKVLLVTRSNVFLEKALGLLDGVTVHTAREAGESDSGYDLYVYDGVFPQSLPTDGNLLLIDPESNGLFAVGSETEISAVTVRDSSYFGGRSQVDFAVARAKALTTPVWAETILAAPETPLIFAGETGGQRVAVIGFDLHDSDLPLQVEFPMLVAQLESFLAPGAVENQNGLLAGQPVELTLRPDATAARVLTPTGQALTVAPPFPAQSLTNTRAVGVYTLVQENAAGAESRSYFAINPDTAESDLYRAETAETAKTEGVAAAGWISLQMLLLIVLLVLLAWEWWVTCRVR